MRDAWFFQRWASRLFAFIVVAGWIAAAFLVLPGCASLAANAISPQVGPELSRAVGRYCADLTQSERELVRSSLNAQLSPHRISITCEGDLPATPAPLLLDIPLPAAPSSEPFIVHLRL